MDFDEENLERMTREALDVAGGDIELAKTLLVWRLTQYRSEDTAAFSEVVTRHTRKMVLDELVRSLIARDNTNSPDDLDSPN